MYAVKRSPQFDDWLASIKDGLTRIRLAKRLDKAQRGLLGDVEPVGEGVSEMREFFAPGWRMCYVERNTFLIHVVSASITFWMYATRTHS